MLEMFFIYSNQFGFESTMYATQDDAMEDAKKLVKLAAYRDVPLGIMQVDATELDRAASTVLTITSNRA